MMSANRIELVAASPDHADFIGRNMRDVDRQELLASSMASPLQTVLSSFARSEYSFTGLVDSKPVMILGVVSSNRIFRVGIPWMIATSELEGHSMQFLRGCAPVLDMFRQDFSYLYNHVDARNDSSIRWLKWLGFDLDEPEIYGHRKMLFHRFGMRGYSSPSLNN